MRIDVLTLFPGMFTSFRSESIAKRALEAELFSLFCWDIRAYTTDKHRTTDDYPFGGGAGMLMKPEPVAAAFDDVLAQSPLPAKVVYLSPCGQTFSQQYAKQLAALPRLVLLCGHYEGMDQRVLDTYVDEEISIGDYVLSGGELPAMVLIDTVMRLLPGVLGSEHSTEEESFENDVLEYPQYTRPASFREQDVPEILLQGNHGAIARWRRQQALLRTLERRPDLLLKAKLSVDDKRFLAEVMASRAQSEVSRPVN